MLNYRIFCRCRTRPASTSWCWFVWKAFAPGLVGGWVCRCVSAFLPLHLLQTLTSCRQLKEITNAAAALGFLGDQARSSDILQARSRTAAPEEPEGRGAVLFGLDVSGALPGEVLGPRPAWRPPGRAAVIRFLILSWKALEYPGGGSWAFLQELLPQQPQYEKQHLSQSQIINTRIISVGLA